MVLKLTGLRSAVEFPIDAVTSSFDHRLHRRSREHRAPRSLEKPSFASSAATFTQRALTALRRTVTCKPLPPGLWLLPAPRSNRRNALSSFALMNPVAFQA